LTLRPPIRIIIRQLITQAKTGLGIGLMLE